MKEYRDLRARHSFLDLCKDSDLACEVSVYAVQRLGVDAAIIFSDILLILEPMGLHLEYSQGEGPLIDNPIRSSAHTRSPTATTAMPTAHTHVGIVRRVTTISGASATTPGSGAVTSDRAVGSAEVLDLLSSVQRPFRQPELVLQRGKPEREHCERRDCIAVVAVVADRVQVGIDLLSGDGVRARHVDRHAHLLSGLPVR